MRKDKASWVRTSALAAAGLAGMPALVHATTIANIWADGNGTYEISGTVTAVLDSFKGNYTFDLQDSTGGILAFSIPSTTYTPEVGDTIEVNATSVLFDGAPEFEGSKQFTLISSAGTGTAGLVYGTPTVLTIPQFNASGSTDGGAGVTGGTGSPPYSETLVELQDVYLPAGTTSVSSTSEKNYTLTDSEGNTADLFTEDYSNVDAAAAAADAQGPGYLAQELDIIGYADSFKGQTEIYPLAIIALPEPASAGLLAGVVFTLTHRRSRKASV
jgi:hypothetical protein